MDVLTFVVDYRVATLSTLYLNVLVIIIPRNQLDNSNTPLLRMEINFAFTNTNTQNTSNLFE